MSMEKRDVTNESIGINENRYPSFCGITQGRVRLCNGPWAHVIFRALLGAGKITQMKNTYNLTFT